MNRRYVRKCLLAAVLLSCSLFSGCGCAKEKDPESQQVMEITITPDPTPTPDPMEINPDAVVTNGNMTMVNEYLAGE